MLQLVSNLSLGAELCYKECWSDYRTLSVEPTVLCNWCLGKRCW